MRSACLIAWLPFALMAQRAEIKDKNVVFLDAAGVAHQLTQSGRDADANLSPDQKTIVFARQVWGETADTHVPVVTESEIRVTPVDGKTQGRRLFSRPAGDAEWQHVLDAPAFSPDGRRVYFMSDFAATSGALWKLDLSTGHARMLIPGAIGYIVVQKGSRRGSLIVQRRSVCNGGTVDHETFWHACYPFYLFTADGRVVRRIADERADLATVAGRYH